MQFLRTFFTGMLIVVVGGLLLFFGGREVLVFAARFSLQREINTLRSYKANPGQYSSRCANTFATFGSSEPLSGFQVRFLDEKHYQIEVVCSSDTTQPVMIKEKSLPFYAKKLPGSSGVFLGVGAYAPSSFDVSVYGRKTTVALSPGEGELINTAAVYPASVCTGWGYFCCDPETEVNSGQGLPGSSAFDCPGSCSSVCLKRPLVYAFNADPSYNAVTRSVSILPGTAVQFAYVIGDMDGSIDSVTVKFGDGGEYTEEATDIDPILNSGTVQHTYECPSTSCTYTATLILTDNDGLEAPKKSVSTIQVNVFQN